MNAADTNKALVRALDSSLRKVDSVLAASGVLLPDRPLAAALLLVEYEFVRATDQRGHPVCGPDSSGHFGLTPWFRALHRGVETWYLDQYGRAMHRVPPTGIRGAVLTRGTGFEVRVPTTRVRPAEPGQTIWLKFLDRVEDDEAIFDWLINPPNLDRLDPQSHKQLAKDHPALPGLGRNRSRSLLRSPADRLRIDAIGALWASMNPLQATRLLGRPQMFNWFPTAQETCQSKDVARVESAHGALQQV
jgi:hypothetical protein